MTGYNISWNLIGDIRFMLQFPFIVTAYEAGTVIALVAGIVSYLVVLRRSSFAAHALGHIGFSGAAGAVLFGANPLFPLFGLLLFTTGGGTGMAILGSKASQRDVEIGTILAFMLALGVLFLAYYNGFADEAYSILFGELVGISPSQVEFTVLTAIPVLVALALVYRQLLFASLDEEVAEAKGMHTLLLGWIFMLALAVAISIAVTIIGVLLIFALTVTPAAIAMRLAKRPLVAVTLAVLIALGAMWAGIFIGFWLSVGGTTDLSRIPTSFYIVALVFVTYVIVRAIPVVRPPLLRLVRRPAPQPAPAGTPRVASPPVPESVTESKSA
jgi:zinc/manganese transport system permease protein